MDEAEIAFISRLFGTCPIMLDAALFCSNHRVRLFWTNCPLLMQAPPPSKHQQMVTTSAAAISAAAAAVGEEDETDGIASAFSSSSSSLSAAAAAVAASSSSGAVVAASPPQSRRVQAGSHGDCQWEFDVPLPDLNVCFTEALRLVGLKAAKRPSYSPASGSSNEPQQPRLSLPPPQQQEDEEEEEGKADAGAAVSSGAGAGAEANSSSSSSSSSSLVAASYTRRKGRGAGSSSSAAPSPAASPIAVAAAGPSPAAAGGGNDFPYVCKLTACCGSSAVDANGRQIFKINTQRTGSRGVYVPFVTTASRPGQEPRGGELGRLSRRNCQRQPLKSRHKLCANPLQYIISLLRISSSTNFRLSPHLLLLFEL